MAEKDQESAKKTRQRIIIIILVLVAGIFAWLMFGGKSEEETTTPAVAAAAPPPRPLPTPKPAELPKPAPLTQREIELIQLQQQTEAKYVAAVNELQMLKVQRDIAETNKAIASAKLDTVNAQKNIVTLLAPAPVVDYSQRLTNPTGTETAAQPTPAGPPPNIVEVAYTVISVTEIQGRWGAVIGAQGKLFNVHVGDVLPTDSSKVININRSGVVLEKNGVRKTVSLVPII